MRIESKTESDESEVSGQIKTLRRAVPRAPDATLHLHIMPDTTLVITGDEWHYILDLAELGLLR